MRLAIPVCLVAFCLAAPAALAQDFGPLPRLASPQARAQAYAAGFRASAPPPAPVRAIAEFERSEAVVVSYSDWIDVDFMLPVELIARLSEHVRVISLHNDLAQHAQIEAAYAAAGVTMANVEFFRTPTDSPWTRDYGPFYVADGDGQIGIVDFIYDVGSRTQDNTAPSALAGHLGVPLYTMDLVHTGGNYMTTGAGSAASTTRLLDYNTGVDEAAVRQTLETYLGLTDYFVFPDPQATYIDHIDTWAKFLDVDKVLIAQASPGHPDYAALEAIAAEFAETTSPWGTPYQVVRVFAPDRQPYTNSLIVNDHVYVATDGQDPDLDAAALQTYRDAMPGYTVHGVDFPYWHSTDALHCRTKEVADMGMLSVRHQPLSGDVPGGELTVDAEIIAYSGEALLEDDLHLIYRTGKAPYDTLALARTAGDTFRATLPALPDGAEVSYYLSASDASGRTEHFPLVGPDGPRTFRIAPPTAGEAAPTAALGLTAAPNPTAGPLTIRYALPDGGEVTLDVLDVLGRRVARLHDGPAAPGEHRAVWNASGAPSGVYLVRLVGADGARELRRVTVAR